MNTSVSVQKFGDVIAIYPFTNMEVHLGLQMTSNKVVAVNGHIILDFSGSFQYKITEFN